MNLTTNTKLGLFVLSGITVLILGLYYIGSKRNIFRSTIKVSAIFTNVDGLLTGHNVRFNGINVGTISKVISTSDTLVKVEFTIDREYTRYISKNAIASLGSDGLLGDKLINITGVFKGKKIEAGDVLQTLNSVQFGNVMRTFSSSNENIRDASFDVKEIMYKLNHNRSLWSLFEDTVISGELKQFSRKIKLAGIKSELAAENLSHITGKILNGKGSFNEIIGNEDMASDMKNALLRLHQASDSIVSVSKTVTTIATKINSGEGTLGALLNDTILAGNLLEGVSNLKEAAGGFKENMDAAKESWPFKKHFRKLNKKNKIH
jgi:phospholipid/cholesterol/gamma-HCH transport system substrate-binding protein